LLAKGCGEPFDHLLIATGATSIRPGIAGSDAIGIYGVNTLQSGIEVRQTVDRITFSLEPVGPFRLDLTAWPLRRRAENIIDRWDGSTYRRVLIEQELPVEIEVFQAGPSDIPLLSITVTGTELSSDTKTLIIFDLTRLLGTNADLSEFYRFAEHQPKLDALVRQFRGVKPPRFPTLFEALVNAIACQQLSLNVGILPLNRLSAAFGQSGPGQGALAHALPAPEIWRDWIPKHCGISFHRGGLTVDSSISTCC
jgi:DNA-3-methyladenine glycosylase II